MTQHDDRIDDRPRRLPSARPVRPPHGSTVVALGLAAVIGVTASVLFGALIPLVVILGLAGAELGYLAGRLRNRAHNTTIVIPFVSVLLVVFTIFRGPDIAWALTTYAGVLPFFFALGTLRLARLERRDAAIAPTDPRIAAGVGVVTWQLGTQRWEMTNPSEKRMRSVIRGPRGNRPDLIEVARGSAVLSLTNPPLFSPDPASAPFSALVDPRHGLLPDGTAPAIALGDLRGIAFEESLAVLRTGRPGTGHAWHPVPQQPPRILSSGPTLAQ